MPAPQSPVLVTGGSGFIGSALVASLLADGAEVRVLTRSAERARARLPSQVDLIEGDIADPETAPRAVRGCATIFHLAGPFREANIPDRRYWDVQLDGTRQLMEAAHAAGVGRIVHTSTIGVLGHIAKPPADEESPYNPGDPYQESKAEAEKWVLRFQREHDAPIAIARPASAYGPGDLRFLKLFRAIQRGWFVMLGSGRVHLHLIYIDDLVDGLRRLAVTPDAVGQPVILAGERSLPLNQLVRLLSEILGAKPPRLRFPAWPVQLAGSLCEAVCVPFGITPPIYRRRVDFFTKSRSFRTDKARRLLGFAPGVDLSTGLRRTAEWYRAEGLLG